MAESGRTRRRQRWAQRESRRRQANYRLRYERWSRIDAVLGRWLDMARTFDGYDAAASVPTEVRLRRDERLFGSFYGAGLVEVNRPTGVFDPAASQHFSALREADGQAPRLIARDRNRTLVCFDNGATDRETHAKPLWLRRVKGFKRTGGLLRVHAEAGVLHRN